MAKRILAGLLALILLPLLAACGESPAVSQKQTPSTAPSAVATVPPATAAPTQKVRTQEVHSGLREDGTFCEGTLFIGDSLTYGFLVEYLMRYELIGDAKYMAVVGAPLSRFFSSAVLSGDGSLYSREFAGLSYSAAAAQMGDQATAIYLMLGTNDSANAAKDSYIEVVDYLLEVCPNATVYLQTIPYSSRSHVDYASVNTQLQETAEYYLDQGQERVFLIDTFSFIGQCVGGDGIHLNDEGRDAWYLALCAHKNEQNIPE